MKKEQPRRESRRLLFPIGVGVPIGPDGECVTSMHATGIVTDAQHGGNPMLVLSRRVGEEVVISGNIRIKLLEVRSGKIRLGITAPPEVQVDRAEIHDWRAWAGNLAKSEEKAA